jgi:hypothetical protein
MFQLQNIVATDLAPPTCGGTAGGNVFNGTATDDVGIAAIQLVAGTNTKITSIRYNGPQAAIFQVTKPSPLLSGSGTVEVTDVGGNTCQVSFTIPVPKGDFSGDGKADLLFQHTSGNIAIWDMDGVNRTAAAATVPPNPGDPNWKIVAAADFNGDANTDILFQYATTGDLVVWHMNGFNRVDGVFTVPSNAGDVNWKVMATGDFNNDGHPDLLWRNVSTGMLVVWYMNDVTMTGFAVLNPSTVSDLNWAIVGTGDFNGDGNTDILWQNNASGALIVWYMNGVNRIAFAALDPNGVSDTNWKVRAVGDYNGDGKPDIVWQYTPTGDILVWFMNGVIRTGFSFTNPMNAGDPGWKVVGPK